MKTENANMELIMLELRSVSGRVNGISERVNQLPTKSEVKLIVVDGIQNHEDRCEARGLPVKVAENTQQIKIVTSDRLRRSLAPAARAAINLPPWAKVLIPAILTALLGALGYSAQ